MMKSAKKPSDKLWTSPLRKEGMRLESATKGIAKIAGEATVNKVGNKYSSKAPTNQQPKRI